MMLGEKLDGRRGRASAWLVALGLLLGLSLAACDEGGRVATKNSDARASTIKTGVKPEPDAQVAVV